MTSSPTPRVYSKRKGADPIPEGAVYVGRPGPFGNPFDVADASASTRPAAHREVVAAYEVWLAADAHSPLRARARRELRGKDLVCWCQSPSDTDPLPCHATVLLEIANAPDDEWRTR